MEDFPSDYAFPFYNYGSIDMLRASWMERNIGKRFFGCRLYEVSDMCYNKYANLRHTHKSHNYTVLKREEE